jgi:hypothetical protein
MATLQVDTQWPEIGSLEALTGWHRELCIELHGDGSARVFVRAVAQASQKAAELQRRILFHRLSLRFKDLEGCVAAVRADLEALVDSARRVDPSKDNVYAAVTYDRAAWEKVQQGIERWQRR